MSERIAVIEKWVAVADICKCLHNYNGVLQVCAAFQNSSVFRLKKAWEKISKTVCKENSNFIEMNEPLFISVYSNVITRFNNY